MTVRKIIVLIIFIAILVGSFWAAIRLREVGSGLFPILKPAPSLPVLDEDLPFTVPDGFAVSVFSRDVPGARVLTRDFKGTLVASLTSEGRVVALPDTNGDHKADATIDILTGLNNPHGILFRCDPESDASRLNGAGQNGNDCRMYVAEEDVVLSYAYDPETFTASLPRDIASLPRDGGHSTRTILAHPDGEQLLVSVGSSCNVCEEKDARRAKVLAFNIKEGAFGTYTDFSTGLRNMVFMTIHPVTGEIWGTEMGRDLLGDDTPPDEIDVLRLRGHYGWPYCYGKNIQDTTFEPANPGRCQKMDPSHIDIPAHSAPLGLAFVPEEGWPEAYWHDLLVAYHGSWNRSVPTGYKIVRFDLDPLGKPTGDPPAGGQDFITGF
ncbi:MAG: PQQ-dependent sugar dehydrogenase, partial [bacterium]|nr:PQQ-dependent sugar dehydrogenase [bacterium]